jgi:acyl carrier protein/GNAT superfamily N-acetyltransferase
MTKEQIAEQVVHLIRQRAMSGSEREISKSDPLGEQGLGLDSLALIEFVTSLEKHFAIEIPYEIWTEGSKLTLQHFIDLIGQSLPAHAPGEGVPTAAGASGVAAAPVDEQPVQQKAQGHTLARWKKSLPATYLFKISKLFFERESYLILERDLTTYHPPAFASPLNPALRQAAIEDQAALEAFWNSFRYYTLDRKKMDMALFRQRLATGYSCMTAWLDGQIIGVDWLLERAYYCPHTGLELSWPSDSIYAGELYEHAEFRGKGIGLTLLAFSLDESRKNGYLRQVTLVAARNTKMLGAALQMFGFRKSGEIHTTRIFRQPLSVWRIGERSGRGGRVNL